MTEKNDNEPVLSNGPTATSAEVSIGVAADDALAPQRIGHYRIIRELGKGGMGVVYEAEQDSPKRTVALKVINAGVASSSMLARFQHEAQVLGKLQHPGIAQVYEAGTFDIGAGGQPYFAMELIHGQPLSSYATVHDLGTRQRLGLLAKIGDAVQHAHQRGVIHRDLKPNNILVDESGQPKILDFGVARATDGDIQTTTLRTDIGQLIGTVPYMSPEQAGGDPDELDTRSDVYALGVVAYELLAGRLPYDVKNKMVHEAVRVIREVLPAPLSSFNRVLRGDVETIVGKAMEKDKTRRYQSASAFSADVRRHLNNEPIAARPPSAWYQLSKFARRNKGLVTAAAAIVLVLFAGIVATSWQANVATAQREVADTERDRAVRHLESVLGLSRKLMDEYYRSVQTLDGALPVREILVVSALECLNEISEDVDDFPVLKHDLALAYDRLGDIRGGIRNPSAGRLEDAMESYGVALALRRELSEERSSDLDRRKYLAVSLMKVGDVHVHSGDMAAGLAAYNEALELRRALVDADSEEHRRGLAIGLNNVGMALARFGRLDEAEAHYDESMTMRRQLAAEGNAHGPRDVSVQLIDSGELLETRGDFERAVIAYLEALEIREQIARKDPDNGRARRDLAVTQFLLGRVLLAVDRPDEALSYINVFLERARQRQRDNPTSTRARKDLALGHQLDGMARSALDDHAGALKSFHEFEAIVVSLVTARPANARYQELLIDVHERIGETQMELGDLAEAARSHERALATVQRLVRADPANFGLEVAAARNLSALGDVSLLARRQLEAEHHLDQARAAYESLLEREPGHAAVRWGLITTLALQAKRLAVNDDRDRAIETTEEALSLLADAPAGPRTDRLRRTLEANIEAYRRSSSAPMPQQQQEVRDPHRAVAVEVGGARH